MLNFVIEIHKLCLYGDVKLFEKLKNEIDFNSFYDKYCDSLSYCIVKGAYINIYFYNLYKELNIDVFSTVESYLDKLYNNCDDNDLMPYNNNKPLNRNFNFCYDNIDVYYDNGHSVALDLEFLEDEYNSIKFNDNMYFERTVVYRYGLICFDKYIFSLFLNNNYTSNFIMNNYTAFDILRNTDLAMYLYKNNKCIDLCISRFLLADYDLASPLVKENTFLRFFCQLIPTRIDEEYRDFSNLSLKHRILLFYYYYLYTRNGNYFSFFDYDDIKFVEYNVLKLYYLYNDTDKIDYITKKLNSGFKIIKLFDFDKFSFVNEEFSFNNLLYNSIQTEFIN